MKTPPESLASIAPLAARYDAFLLDLWGVIHDGQNLYPNVKDCLVALRKQEKKIVFLSNAPRRANVVADVLAHMGITPELYDAIVTSGETAYQCLAHPEDSFFKPRGKHYIYIGLEKDRRTLDGLHYEEASHPEFSQFVLLAHSYYDNQPLDELMSLLKKCVASSLPMLCINPDMEVVRLSGERVYCAGVIAEHYRMMGGEVIYFGKPHRAVYEASLHLLDGIPKSRIVAVGDSLKTDIKGAVRSGLACALVTGGILRETLNASDPAIFATQCQELFEREEVAPTYIVPVFNW